MCVLLYSAALLLDVVADAARRLADHTVALADRVGGVR